jgi:hypothetical protein
LTLQQLGCLLQVVVLQQALLLLPEDDLQQQHLVEDYLLQLVFDHDLLLFI